MESLQQMVKLRPPRIIDRKRINLNMIVKYYLVTTNEGNLINKAELTVRFTQVLSPITKVKKMALNMHLRLKILNQTIT